MRANAENIHPEKRVRIGRLKLLPVVEISERSRLRIALPEGSKGLGRQFEAEKQQSMLGKESLDLWQGVTVLEHIKKQIAAATDAVEIPQRDKALFDAVFDAENLLAARANSLQGRGITALRDKRAAGDNGAACDLAVKADTHRAARPQQRKKDAPASSWTGEVMQNAHRLDEIESPVECAEFENVGVRVVDIIEAGLARFLRA